jgi:predicted dehydrogenase
MTGKQATLYGDYRKLLENKDIDTVIIATPDHWHCLIMVDACEAGKDVYVEKPMANSIQECGIMVRAAKRYNSVVQVGQWQRSGQHWDDAISFATSGKIGKIRAAKAWSYVDWKSATPVLPDEPVPDGVDYDMWLGPAPKRPFNRNRFHFTFRWFWDYAGGLMTDWGVHMIDMVLKGMDATAPKSVMAGGGKFAFPDDAAETPDTLTAVYEFDDFLMTWEHTLGIGLGPYRRPNGVAFIGELGTVVVDRGKWEVWPEIQSVNWRPTSYKMESIPTQRISDDGGLDAHMRNFLDCVKTREQPVCSPEIGALAAVNAHLGNIAFRTGRKVYWDHDSGAFIGDDEANEMVKVEYRKPWKLPNV